MRKDTFITSLGILLLLTFSTARAQEAQPSGTNGNRMSKEDASYKKGKLLYKDDFNSGLDNWVIEAPSTPDSRVAIENNKLIIDVDGGATVWLDKKLSGNIMIEYQRKVLMEGGKNDRLSDLNQFWMATDPRNSDLFTRSGVFSEYDSLLMYYVGVGGNYNSTTRFRKYTGDGQRVLHNDLQEQEYLLEPNKEYTIQIVVYNGLTSFSLNGEELFSFQDPDPLQEGYFGFRTVKSRQAIEKLRIYQLK